MAYEDFENDYTEVDSASDITLSTVTCTVDTMQKVAISHVTKDKDADWLTGDFEHKFEFQVTVDNAGAQVCCYAVWEGLAASLTACKAANKDGIIVIVQDAPQLSLLGYTDGDVDGVDTMSNLKIDGTWYFVTVKRVGSTRVVTVTIRETSHEAAPVDTLTITPASNASLQFIYGVQSYGATGAGDASLVVRNLDLQEAVSISTSSVVPILKSIGILAREFSPKRIQFPNLVPRMVI